MKRDINSNIRYWYLQFVRQMLSCHFLMRHSLNCHHVMTGHISTQTTMV